jgi:MYXO-CTERM domain-containing protein
MKKLFLLLVAAASFNVNAALITVSTDKATYNVGDTIVATVSATNLALPGGFQTLFSGYSTLLTFNASLLDVVSGSAMSLAPYGPDTFMFPAELLSPPTVSGNNIGMSSVAFNFNPASQLGRNSIGLFSVSFIAKAIGDTVLAMGPSFLSDPAFPFPLPTQVGTQNASFTITQVSAPGTGLLAALALAGLIVVRRRASH